MLAEHGVDEQRAANVVRRIDVADLDMWTILGGVHLLHVVA